MHRKMILISAMLFMDPYNFDLERVQRCVIHYALPDGAHNSILHDELHTWTSNREGSWDIH